MDDIKSVCEIDKLVAPGVVSFRERKLVKKDPYFVVHLLFLMFGIIYILPVNFFVTANGYWMHKFRNVSSLNKNASERSILQSNFASSSQVASMIPLIVFMVLTTIFGYKIKVRTRLFAMLFVLFGCLAVSIGFIKVDTNYCSILTFFFELTVEYKPQFMRTKRSELLGQEGFFAFTMLTLVVLNGALAIFQVTSLVLVSKFPPRFMKIYLVGQGIGGVLCSAVEVISVAIGTSSEASATIYFTVGTVFMGFTLSLYYFIGKVSFYRYYTKHSLEDTNKDLIKFDEVRVLSKKIWSSLVVVMAGALSYIPTHPAIASLVDSEGADETLWKVTYFVPTITFLYSDICSAVGRIISAAFPKSVNDSWLAALSVIKMIIFIPLFMFCNAQPRKYLPVLFPHDWEYILILGAFMVSSSYLHNIAFFNIPRLAPKEEETAYMLMQTVIGIVSAVFSPLGIVCVNWL